jgi:aminobutyraldehyde dehydrogenase
LQPGQHGRRAAGVATRGGDDLAHRLDRQRRKVLAAAVNGTKRTHLELGGKAPVIVFDDADLESVVSGVRTFGFYNAGQDCTAACRIYAAPKIHDKLVADLSAAASSIKVGTQEEDGVEMGPLITAKHRSR